MTRTPLDPSLARALEARYGGAPAQAVLEVAVDAFQPRLACACSLGLEDVVLVDLVARLGLPVRIFFLDTGRMHQETYDTLAALRLRYRLPIEVWFPLAEPLQAMLAAKGPNAFYGSREDRLECCRIRKVEPLGRALRGADAWLTGARREQSPTRAGLPVFQWEAGRIKISPLAGWSLDQVWDYVRSRQVPYNPLHDQGFPSIGCAPCTRAVAPGEPVRAGRWWWEAPEHRECGLHRPAGAP